jgi:hypothetical protein
LKVKDKLNVILNHIVFFQQVADRLLKTHFVFHIQAVLFRHGKLLAAGGDLYGRVKDKSQFVVFFAVAWPTSVA